MIPASPLDSVVHQQSLALAPGLHQLCLHLRPPSGSEHPTQLMICLAGREIGFTAVHDSLLDAPGGTVTYRFPFVVRQQQEHALEVRAVPSPHGHPPAKEPVTVEAVRVESWEAPAQPELPGPPALDLWGWCALAWHCFAHRFRVGTDYMLQRGVIEPSKWGCNFMQTHTYAYLDWHHDLVVAMHERGLLVDEHGFPPQRRLNRVDGQYQVFRVYVQGSRKLPKSQEHLWPERYVPERTLEFVQRWGRDFSNNLRHGWRGTIDGWETEEYAVGEHGVLSCEENLIALNHQAWAYNPGLCIGSCNHTAAYAPFYRIWLHEGFHGPNYAHVAMDAGSSWQCCLPGYDDHVPPGSFPGNRSFQNSYNDVFLGYQADSRFYPSGRFGGLTGPDWLVKQAHDFCRPVSRDRTAPPSALFWLADSWAVLPEEIRAYAYLACHDAPYAAIAMTLSTTGCDGRWHWLADAYEDYLGGEEDTHPAHLCLRPREHAAATTAILQNNLLRLERDALATGGCLRYDPEGLAHFDNDSLSHIIADRLLEMPAHDILEEATPQLPWRSDLKLAAGSYRLRLARLSGGTLQLRVNQRLAGILDEDRLEATFCLPESSQCQLELQGQASAGGLQLQRTDDPAPTLLNELEIPSGRLETPQLWPLELMPGSYLLAVAAEGPAGATLRIGLDADRFAHTIFADKLAADGRLGRVQLLAGERCYVTPFTILRGGEHQLELVGAEDLPPQLRSVRLYRVPVLHEIPLPGGVKAELREPDLRCELLNDLSMLRLHLPDRAQARRLLRRRSGLAPPLRLRSPQPLEERGDDVWLPAGKATVVDLILPVGHLATASPPADLEPVTADGEVPAGSPVQAVQVSEPQEGPYLVQEAGWWRVRGGQPVTMPADEAAHQAAYRRWQLKHERPTPKTFHRFSLHQEAASPAPIKPVAYDLVKVYTGTGPARVLPFGFIEGVVRPGHGCQYTMALTDVTATPTGATFRVQVDRLTAYVFAPRLHVAQPIAEVTLDGAPWHYLDNDLLLLPQHRGTYTIEVTFGERRLPSLTRTAAAVVATRIEDDAMIIDTDLPDYVRAIPDDLRYHAALRTPPGERLQAGDGSRYVRHEEQGVVISFRPGRCRLRRSQETPQ